MNEKIEPAMTAAQWRDVLAQIEAGEKPYHLIVEDLGAAARIALENHLLCDDDARKITRARIEAIRSAARDAEADGMDSSRAAAFADALESYLPPEPAT